MSNDIEKSDTGVWVDSQTDEVVYEQPAEGVQLVPPGGELTPLVKQSIERHSTVAPSVPVDVTDPEAPKPVKADAAKKAK